MPRVPTKRARAVWVCTGVGARARVANMLQHQLERPRDRELGRITDTGYCRPARLQLVHADDS